MVGRDLDGPLGANIVTELYVIIAAIFALAWGPMLALWIFGDYQCQQEVKKNLYFGIVCPFLLLLAAGIGVTVLTGENVLLVLWSQL